MKTLFAFCRQISRRAFVDIAHDIGLSESAVRRRVKNLVDRNIIKRFTIELGISDKTSAITLISVSRLQIRRMCLTI